MRTVAAGIKVSRGVREVMRERNMGYANSIIADLNEIFLHRLKQRPMKMILLLTDLLPLLAASGKNSFQERLKREFRLCLFAFFIKQNVLEP